MKNLTRFIVRQITSTGSSIVLSFLIFANLSYSVRFVAFAVNILIICFSQFDLFNWGFDKYAASMQKYSSNNRCSTFCCTFKLDSWAASKHGKLTRKKYHWWDCWESISCSDGESAGKEAWQSAGWRREKIENSVPIFHHRINIYEINFFILVTCVTFNGRFVWCCTRYERSCWSMFHFMVKYLRFWCRSGPRPIQIKKYHQRNEYITTFLL